MKIEETDYAVYFYNDDGIMVGHLSDYPEGYRMGWYAGIVITGEELRIVNRTIVNFLNRVILKSS